MSPQTQALNEFASKHDLTSRAISEHLKVSSRLVRYWMAEDSEKEIPYASAIALRCLVEHDHT